MKLVDYLPDYIRADAKRAEQGGLEEIRLRMGQPIEFLMGDGKIIWGTRVSRSGIEEVINYLTGYSWSSVEEQLKQGFFTIEGGHRVGVAGRCGHGDLNITSLTDINAVNIRVAHERVGCGMQLIPFIRKGDSIFNTMLVSEPGVGKTTYLRDCIRIISSGADNRASMRVGVVDERSEIAACHRGIPQNNVGPRTDVMDNCPKLVGMKMLLRSMSPQVIAVDELDGKKECLEVKEIVNSGVKFICSVHASSIDELMDKQALWELIEGRIFKRIIILSRDTEGRRDAKVFSESWKQIC